MTVQHSSEPNMTGPEAAVRSLMTRAVARISPDARLSELAQKLASVEAGALAVGTTTSLLGIASERDLTRAYGRSENPEGMKVHDIASTDLIWCGPDTTAIEAARVMCERGVRHLLVGDQSTTELQGIVSARALLEALVA